MSGMMLLDELLRKVITVMFLLWWMFFKCLSDLCTYMASCSPLPSVLGKKLKAPCRDTVIRVREATSLTSDTRHGGALELKSMLCSLPSNEDILSIVDGSGFNLLQRAIIHKKKDILNILINKNVDLNRGGCSPPLHLACYLGYADMVEYLLENGAKPDLSAGLCYPNPHVPISYRLKNMGRTTLYHCQLQTYTPIQFALNGDHVVCIKFLLDALSQDNVKDDNAIFMGLQNACCLGSLKCIKCLLMRYPEMINRQDTDGLTPLLMAVHWGEESLHFLLERGACIKKLSKKGETALHRLYRNQQDGPLSIFNTTDFLMKRGLDNFINHQDAEKETPLNLLIGHISYSGRRFSEHMSLGMPQWQLQEIYQKQVIQAIQLLLDGGARVDLGNSSGQQPVSKLIHIALQTLLTHGFKTYLMRKMYTCLKTGVPVSYKIDFSIMQQALSLLLEYGARPNTECPAGHTPLNTLLQCLTHGDVTELCSQSDGFIGCAEELLLKGGNPNFPAEREGAWASFLAGVALQHVEQPIGKLSEVNPAFVAFLNRILLTLLKHGIEPNTTDCKKRPFLQGGDGNSLIEFIRIAKHAVNPEGFQAVNMFVRTLLQWGANPNLEPYPSEPIICQCQSSIYLKRQGTQPLAHYLHLMKDVNVEQSDGIAEEILLLFYKTMEHKLLHECFNSAVSLNVAEILKPARFGLESVVTRWAHTPRSLKQMSRISIYGALKYQISQRVPELPLPRRLKEYLISIE